MSEETTQVAAVPTDLFNQITNYLMSRPYNEVAKIVDELRQGVQLVEMNTSTPATPSEEVNDD
jgi:hypothetical protein